MNSAEPTIRLPAEWEPQDGILLAWPHADSDWQLILPEITSVYLQLTHEIQKYQTVLIATPEPDKVAGQLRRAGTMLDRVRLCQVATNDTWTRDYGPITVLQHNQPVLLDFGFNGWGLKFPADRDNRVTANLHAVGAFGTTPKETIGLILEGGSIESDGHGTLLTTSTCLLNANRNPHLDKRQIEAALRQHLGAQQVHWLEHGYLAGDDTDSHIDTLARFCPNDTILYVRCTDPQDEHYAALQNLQQQLIQLRTRQGKAYRLLALPWPQACFDKAGKRLPATYANYLVINGAVLVPSYQDPADELALQTIAKAYPEREVFGIDCRPIIQQHGSLHCISMQLPEGVLA